MNNLKEYIKQNYMFYSNDDQEYTLSSGTVSNIYFDIKGLMLDPKGAKMVHEKLLELIFLYTEGRSFNVVGMELGGAQIVQYMVARGFNGVIVRKNKKKYGLQKRMEGSIREDDLIVIVDDVITSGNTVREVRDLFSNRQLSIYCVIDRTLEQKYNSLFKEKDFIEE